MRSKHLQTFACPIFLESFLWRWAFQVWMLMDTLFAGDLIISQRESPFTST